VGGNGQHQEKVRISRFSNYRTQDFFTGEISVRGKKRVDIMGNYMGYMDFNGVRYMDTRECSTFFYPINHLDHAEVLESDARKRLDSIVLQTGDLVQA